MYHSNVFIVNFEQCWRKSFPKFIAEFERAFVLLWTILRF